MDANIISKAELFANVCKTKKVKVPALANKEFLIRELSFAQRNDIQEKSTLFPEIPEGTSAIDRAKLLSMATRDLVKFAIWSIIHAAVNEDLTPMFSGEDYQKIMEVRPAEVVDILASAVWDWSGTSMEAEKNEIGG